MRLERPLLAGATPALPPEFELRREQRRLRRAFATLVFALGPAALAQACGSAAAPEGLDAGTGGAARGDGGVEAGPGTDSEIDGATPGDAGAPQSCVPVLTQVDAGADAQDLCYYMLPCGLSGGFSTVGCDLYYKAVGDASIPFGCSVMEGEGCTDGVYIVTDGGPVTLSCPGCLGGGGGRRPRGLAAVPAIRAPTALGAYFARMAHDEAASVHAFRRLRDELVRHGAPSGLVLAATRAAGDEARHARLMTRRARAHGATVPRARVRRGRPRSLEAMARENAVEGCVHETFGALLLRWQAAHALGASTRRMFARIAEDETRHAALAWTVARWAEGRLDGDGRARVCAARTRALRGLGLGAQRATFASPVGRPDAGVRVALIEGMTELFGLG